MMSKISLWLMALLLLQDVAAKNWSFDSSSDSSDDGKSSFESFIKAFWGGARPDGCPSSYNACFRQKSCSQKKPCPENSTCCPSGFGGFMGHYGGGCCVPKKTDGPSGEGPVVVVPINPRSGGGSSDATTAISVEVNVPEVPATPAPPPNPETPEPRLIPETPTTAAEP